MAIGLGILLATLLSMGRPGWTAEPENTTMPVVLQVVLFKKIFSYNKRLPPSINLLILYAKEFKPMAEEVQKRLEKPELHVELSLIDSFTRPENQVQIVYILASSPPATVKSFCMREQVFSVSPLPTLAERGDVSVAVGVKPDNKPEIIVHLGRSKQEGQELELALLSLARIIR